MVLATSGLTGAEKPNIVVILSDDLGWGSVGCYGADPKLVRTPGIDRLAKEGRRFTDANTPSSVCSPTRYALMPGQYCWRTSAKSGVLSTFSPLHIQPGQMNMASLLKKHGYNTAAVGKWHLGYGDGKGAANFRADYTAELSPGPLDIGFDYHFGVPSNHGDMTGIFVENRFVYGLRSGRIPAGMRLPGPQPDDDHFKATYTKEDTEGARGNPFAIDAPRRVNERVMPMLTSKAVGFIEKQKAGTPFFLYYTPVAVHNPITPDKDLAGKSAAGVYGDWIHELDRSVAAVLEALDRTGLAKDTLVIFTSDNGGVNKPNITDSPQTKALNAGLKIVGPWKGGKHTVWQGGFRVPFIVRWPGKAPAGTTCEDMVSVTDILATTAAIVGEALPPPDTAAQDSCSFLAAILAEKEAKPSRPDMFTHSSDGVFALRQGPWKWIEGVPVSGLKAATRKAHADEFKPQLYNLVDDPAETKDVSAANSEVVQKLSALLVRYRDGGYSRELPPIVEKPKPVVVAPLVGESTLSLPASLEKPAPWAVANGAWAVKDGAIWGGQKKGEKPGAALRAPLGLTDATLEYQLSFDGADRHSLRVQVAGGKRSFRIEVSPGHVGITKNPEPGEAQNKTQPLARQAITLDQNTWYPVRITFKGTTTTVEIAGVTLQATDEILGLQKELMNLLVFDKSLGFRGLKLVR